MQGGSGWLGALFLLGFAGGTFAFLFEDDLGALVAGVGACLVAALAFRRWPDSDFAGQLGFAVSLAGQALVAFGLWGLLDERFGAVAALMAVFLAALFALVPGYLHRVWSAWTAAFWAWLALLDAGLGPLVPGMYAGSVRLGLARASPSSSGTVTGPRPRAGGSRSPSPSFPLRAGWSGI